MNLIAHISNVLLQNDGRWLFKSEKVNTLLVVVTVILLGILVYLFLMGRKLNKLEKEMEAQRGKQDSADPGEN